MRRIFLALLICLLSLQGFAGGVMSVQMASMEVTMVASQAPCHEASQPMQTESTDCCSSQAMCQAACPVLMARPFVVGLTALQLQADRSVVFATAFQSADLRAGFKPPIL